MLLSRGLQKPKRCHWSNEFQKKPTFFFPENRAPGILGGHPSTLVDLAITALASRVYREPRCMI